MWDIALGEKAIGRTQDRQYVYDITLQRIHVTGLAMEKSIGIAYSECVCSLNYPGC